MNRNLGPLIAEEEAGHAVTTSGEQTRVVVGVDGSPTASGAALWAAHEAATRGTGLLLVHAEPLHEDPSALETSGQAHHRAVDARALLEREAEHVRTQLPQLKIDGMLLDRAPAKGLIEVGRDAELLVCGSRGRGGFSGMLVGSVSRKLSLHAPCPLVVVRADPLEAVRDEVVLGIGPKHAPAAIRFAFEAAHRYGAELVASRVWTSSLEYGGMVAPGAMWIADYESYREAAALAARKAVEPFEAEFPDVKTRIKTGQGNPVAALSEAANGARLLVVAAHRNRGPLSVGAGYVVDGLIAHSPVPLALVPSP